MNFAPRSFPGRIADLGFRATLPADWVAHPLTEEALAFDNPTFLVPLAIVAAPHAAIALAFAARPAYGDGSLHDWAWYLLRENGLQPSAVGTQAIGALPAIVGLAEQASDLGPMQIRFAFTEDGGRLLNVTLTSPVDFASIAEQVWSNLLRTFELEIPKGSTAPLMPAVEPAPAVTALEDAEPAPATKAEPAQRVSAKRRRKADRKAAIEAASKPKGSRPVDAERAQALEAADRLDEAEVALGRDHPDPGTALRIAELYQQRMNRFLASGDAELAQEAFRRADHWIHLHAAWATSGGEGAALSAERDRFRERLVRDYGGEPG